MKRVALVTGANRGLGFETCRQLSRLGVDVLLASRDQKKGLEAAALLESERLTVTAYQLDVTDAKTILRLVTFIETRFGRLDILVNNAGVYLEHTEGGIRPGILNANFDIVRQTMETNIYGPWRMCQALVPIMQRNQYGRIVNVASNMGQLSKMAAGWPGYRISKAALNALTRILADEVRGTNVLVNSACPGWVRTDMGGANAPLTVEQGADTIVWLATLADDGPSGGFFRERQLLDW